MCEYAKIYLYRLRIAVPELFRPFAGKVLTLAKHKAYEPDIDGESTQFRVAICAKFCPIVCSVNVLNSKLRLYNCACKSL